MKILQAALLLLVASALVRVWANADADALQKLGLPDPPMIVTYDQATASPSVILTDKGALINKATTPVPFAQILAKLAALPKTAWPYGRVVLYAPVPVGVPGYAAPPKPDAAKVESDLQNANIRLIHATGT